MNIAINATDLSDNGWPAPVKTAFATAGAVSLATQVTNLTAQVTALTAQVAALTADYNALAAKWNKRVASKTAPKKKVALK
jgi:outer membrane murein-binding lipoprotein Lpp